MYWFNILKISAIMDIFKLIFGILEIDHTREDQEDHKYSINFDINIYRALKSNSHKMFGTRYFACWENTILNNGESKNDCLN